MLRLLLWALLAYAGVVVLLMLARDRIIFPVRGGRTGEPAEYGIRDGQRVTIETSDGERLAAWYLPPRGVNGAAGAVLWFYGNAERIAALAPVIAELRPETAALLVVDYRGYGESSGRTTVAGVMLDAEAAWRWLVSRPELDSARLVVYGRSVGSGPALHVAANHPVAGLVLESAFTSLRAMARKHYPVFPSSLAGDGFDNLSAIARVGAPALFIHGEADGIVPISMGRELSERHPGPGEFWAIPGAGHNDTWLVGRPDYTRRFREFVARHAG